MALETFIATAPETQYLASGGQSWTSVKEGTAQPIVFPPDPNDTLHAHSDNILVREALLSFDLTLLPYDATIISATLELDVAWVRPDSLLGYVPQIVGLYDSTWLPDWITIADWRKASFLAGIPHSFIIPVSHLTAGQVVSLPFVNLAYLATGVIIGIVVVELSQARNYAEPPPSPDGDGVGAAFYSAASAGRTPPTLTINYASTGGTGVIQGANF